MKTEFQGEPVAGGTFPAGIWKTFMQAVIKIDPPPELKDKDPETVTPGATVVPGAAATVAPATPATPQTEAPQTQGGGTDGGTTSPKQPQNPTPKQPTNPQPAEPAPTAAPPANGGGTQPSGGTGAAPPTG